MKTGTKERNGSMNITEKTLALATKTKETLTKYGLALGEESDEVLATLEDSLLDSDISEVRIVFHRPVASVTLGKLNVARDISSGEYSEFIEKAGSASKIFAFPVFDKKIGALERNLRNLLKRCCIGNTFYMPLSVYEDEFLPKFIDFTDELDELKVALSAEYDELLANFVTETRGILGTLVLPAADKKSIESGISYLEKRGKENFLESVSVELFSGFDSEKIKDEKFKELAKAARQSQTTRLITSILEGSLADAFDALRSFVCNASNCKSGLMDDCSKLVSRLKSAATKCEMGNFGNSDIIRICCEKIRETATSTYTDDAMELAISLMADIYGISISLGFAETLNKSYLPESITPDFLADEYEDRKNLGTSFF